MVVDMKCSQAYSTLHEAMGSVFSGSENCIHENKISLQKIVKQKLIMHRHSRHPHLHMY